jgi:predicted tellurium resistance membrane protein TerC
VWGSTLIAKLMTRHRWIIWLGGGVLGHVAASIIFHDRHVLSWMGLPVPPVGQELNLEQMVAAAPSWVNFVLRYVPWILAVVIFAYGWLLSRVPEAKKEA